MSAFLVLFNDFEKWLCGRLHSAKDPDTFIFKEGEVELSEYVVLPIFPPTNDENLLFRIAQVNHNTKLKLAKFPAPQTQFVDYQKVLGYPRTAEATGMKTIAREFGSLPVPLEDKGQRYCPSGTFPPDTCPSRWSIRAR